MFSYYFSLPCWQTLLKPVIKVLIQSPPSWIAWKKYQLYRATHERMWAMSTTSLSPNMGYVPHSLFLQFILLVLVGRKSQCTAWPPLQQGETHFLLFICNYSNQQTLRFVSKVLVYNHFLLRWIVWWDRRVKSTSVSLICTLWILVLLDLWLWSACHSQLALVNMDVMENPPPVPVRRQKYWRSHLYTWYHALSSGQRGRVAQRLRFAKSQACPLPELNPFNIGQGGSAIDSSLIVKIKLDPRPQNQLYWPMEAGPNL